MMCCTDNFNVVLMCNHSFFQREQLNHHEQRLQQLDRDLHEHRRFPPEKGAKSRVIHDYCDKESYLQFEVD